MKKHLLALGTASLLAMFSAAGQAATINFGPKCSEGGCGTATMDPVPAGIVSWSLTAFNTDGTGALRIDDQG